MTIEREERASVTVLRMRHGKVQAMDLELLQSLDDELQRVEDAEIGRAVVLTGSGSVFQRGRRSIPPRRGWKQLYRRILAAVIGCPAAGVRVPPPVGCCDQRSRHRGRVRAGLRMRLSRRGRGSGTIGLPELRVGVPFPLVPLEIVRFALPAEHLQELVYLGRTYRVDEAAGRGLVDEVVKGGDLIDRACDVASRLVSGPPARFVLAKRQLRGPTIRRIRRHAVEMDREVLRAWKDPETLQAIQSYLSDTIKKSR